MNQLVTLNHSILPSAHSFSSYKTWALSIPTLTEQEEQTLLLKYQQDNDIEAIRQLVISQLKYVIYIANKYKNYGLPEEDLVQEGNIGLMKAIKKFDLTKKVRLYTYTSIWIKAEIQTYICNNWKIIKASTKKALKTLFFNFRKLEREAEHININKHEIDNYIKSNLNVSQEDIDDIKMYLNADSVDLTEIPLDMEVIEPEQPLLLNSHSLTKALNALTDQQRKVIEIKYLQEENITNKEIATQLGISSERVRQLEQSALKNLKNFVI